MNIEKKIELYLENSNEEKIKAKKLVDYFYKKNKGNSKKVHRDILDNVVNNEYTHNSNSFVTAVWDEYKIRFPS